MIIKSFLDFNCNYGLLFKCVNGGVCTSSGTCNCTIGYGGTTCSNCCQKNKNFYFFIFFL